MVQSANDGSWEFFEGCDMPEEGDVERAKNWNEDETTVDELKAICENKLYSGMTLNKDGTAYFKRFHYQLQKKHLKKVNWSHGMWVYKIPPP